MSTNSKPSVFYASKVYLSEKTTSYSVASDFYGVIVCNSSSAVEIEFPAASTASGRHVTVLNKNTGVVTITANSTTETTLNQYAFVELVCDGSAWHVERFQAADVLYDNSDSSLSATRVKDALDELDDEKVSGPSSAVNNNIAVFDGVTGVLIKDGGETISDLQTKAITDGDDLFDATDVEGALEENREIINVLPHVYATNIGNGTDADIVVTHSLGTRDVVVWVRDNSSPYGEIAATKEATSTSTVTLRFGSAPTTDQYRCIIIGQLIT